MAFHFLPIKPAAATAPSCELPVHRFDRALANRVVAGVADYRGLSPQDIYTQTRGPAVRARQESMWLMRLLRIGTYPAIGRRFGKHHTTVIGAVRAIDRRRDNPAYRSELYEILESVREPAS